MRLIEEDSEWQCDGVMFVEWYLRRRHHRGEGTLTPRGDPSSCTSRLSWCSGRNPVASGSILDQVACTHASRRFVGDAADDKQFTSHLLRLRSI